MYVGMGVCKRYVDHMLIMHDVCATQAADKLKLWIKLS